MVYVKWIVALLMATIVISIADYYLPERRVVQIIETEVVRQEYDTTDAAGNEVTRTRDIRQISTLHPDGRPLVFENRDAWMYLKFDSADLYAQAQQLRSTTQNPQWVIITSYGWRIDILSWFPNALSIRPIDEPVDLFPWLRIGIIVGLALALLFIYRMIQLAISRYVDPVIDSVDRELDVQSSALGRAARRFRRMVFGPSR
jgi:hypothetical protein